MFEIRDSMTGGSILCEGEPTNRILAYNLAVDIRDKLEYCCAFKIIPPTELISKADTIISLLSSCLNKNEEKI